MDDLKPFTGKLDSETEGLQPFSGKLDDGSESKFKSGTAFHDSKELLPDLPAMWEQFKKEWANRSNTPMTPEIAQRMMKDEKAAGSAVLDTVGGIPAMAVGGLAGVASGIKNMDASKGLKTGMDTMTALLPSTLMGNEDHQQMEGYKAAMAPVTVAADTFNAVPTGYGEMINAAGYPAAAQQVTDAGKLGIMAVLGGKGAVEMYKSITGKEPKNAKDAADKLEALFKEKEEAPVPKGEETQAHADDFAATNPYDVAGHVTRAQEGRPSTIDQAQGELFGGESLQDAQPAPRVGQESIAHDTIPYTKEFPFGLEPMDQARPETQMGINMPEQESGLSLVPKEPEPVGMTLDDLSYTKPNRMQEALAEAHRDRAFKEHESARKKSRDSEVEAAYAEMARLKENGYNRMEAQREMDYADNYVEPPAPAPNSFERGALGSRDVARARQAEQARMEQHTAAERQRIMQETEQAYAQRPGPNKEADFNRMEAQRELDFADSVSNIENSTARNFFTDRNNQEKVVRPGEKYPSTAREFFLDPRNRDRMDFHGDHEFNREIMGDKTLMHTEATHAMTDALAKGDTFGALDAISKNHENVAYRNLADYLKDRLDGISVKMHDEGILNLGDRHATGYYDPATRTVGFSRAGAVSPHTVLHELVHAVTSDFVNNRPNDMRVLGVKDLYNKLNELGMTEEFPQVSNIKEFLAEAFSNPEFQDFLKQHRVSNRSVWQRFVDNVKSILGLSASTRNHITDALEHTIDLGKQIAEAGKDGDKEILKDAGMPSKLADLMVSRKNRPEPTNTKVGEDVQRLKVPGLTSPISDFTFFDKPIGEIIEMAKASDDIPNTVLEKLSHQLQAGGLFESLKTRNPVVKYTYERITRASQESTRNIKEYLTDPKTGLKAYMRELDPKAKGEIWSAMMMNEGKRVMTPDELRGAGFSEKQIDYYQKQRALDDLFYKQINEQRARMGMTPMDKRVAHIAGRFMGDFSRFLFDESGKIVGRISGNTRGELNRVTKFMSEKHPEWKMGKEEYKTMGKGGSEKDRFAGLMEAINFINKTDANAAKLFDSYKEYLQKDAVNYLNATRHAKAKTAKAGGIQGSEGHKEWMSAEKNADEGMKAQMSYFEQGFSWMAMEKAVQDLKPLLGDEGVVKNTPNAAEWGKTYVDHALGRNNGPLADAANWTASKLGEFTGIGHTNLFKASNLVKHMAMQKFMGLLNIPFSITQLMQPFQTTPAMIALLKNRGLEFSAGDAQVKATQTFLNHSTNELTGKLSAFEKAATAYMKDMGIVDVKMSDHTLDINQRPGMELYNRVADLNITIPETLTRGTAFLFYSHLLKDAGVPMKDIFGAAENMTSMTMVNYHPIERPMGYAKLGWLGDLASTLTRYKHNQASQAAFYLREGIRSDAGIKSSVPLAAFLGTSLAFGGAMGFFGFQEADSAYQLVSEMMGKPDTLTNVVLSSGMPEVISHGVFSTLGLDMTTRFSNANFVPNSIPEALMPYGSAVLDVAQNTGRFMLDPTSPTKFKQMVKSVAPQSVQGLMENKLFTEKQKDGTNLYINSTNGPNMGKGRVARSDKEMALRDVGFRSLRESKELAKNYSDGQIEKANANIVDKLLEKVKYEAMDNSLNQQKLATYIKRAATYGESPDSFVSKVTSWEQFRHLTQEQQKMLRDATGGFKGAINIQQGR